MENTNQQQRISFSDSVIDIIVKMSEGNPGAMVCLDGILRNFEWSKDGTSVEYVLTLDMIGVYGSQLYMLWSDCCDRDFEKLELVLWNYQEGNLTRDDILQQVSGGWGKPFVNLKSKEELKNGDSYGR